MIEYKIAAIPTVYRGRQYRSRLEARWAAFFDALGIRHEYEPGDLGLWSPDFLLPEMNLLVEVKPITSFDEATWSKMVSACRRANFDGAILLTQVAPINPTGHIFEMGWLQFMADSVDELTADRAFLVFAPHYCEPRYTAEIIGVCEPDLWRSVSGDAGSFSDRGPPVPYARHIASLWAQATNSVQWEGPK